MLNPDEIAQMTDMAMWSLIVGFFLPILVSLIKQSKWSKTAKVLLAFALFIVVGFVTAYLSGLLEARTIISSILIIAVVSLTMYQSFYKPTGIDAKVSSVTDKKGHSTSI